MFVGNVAASKASDQTRKKVRIDLVDFGQPDLVQIRHFAKFRSNQTHVLNLELSIALVKSNGCDFISH